MDITFHYTPRELAKQLIESVEMLPTDRLLEPFAGNGAFYDNFPIANPKDWAEIEKGRDFFEYNGKCDIIITNPPFFTIPDRKPIFYQCLAKCFEVAEKKVCVLAATRCLTSFTPLRLSKIAEQGWNITHIKVCNIKEWHGRYYFITFEKKPGFVSFITKSFSLDRIKSSDATDPSRP